MDTNSEKSNAAAAAPSGTSHGAGGRLHGLTGGEDGNGGAPQSTADAFAAAGRHLKELQAYVGHYLSAKADALKLTMKNVVIFAGLGVVGLVAAGGLIVTAVVQLCYGIAGGLGALFGGRLWLGELVTGLVLLGALFGGTYYVLSSLTQKSRKATQEKYEHKQRQERLEHGHDVHERAEQQRRADALAEAAGH